MILAGGLTPTSSCIFYNQRVWYPMPLPIVTCLFWFARQWRSAWYFYWPHNLAKQGDNILGSIRPSADSRTPSNFLSMKWQWTYDPTLLPWNNHFHTWLVHGKCWTIGPLLCQKLKLASAKAQPIWDFWHAAIYIRGSSLPNATKGKEESLSVQGICRIINVSNNCVDAVDQLLM